ncbi:hypothetical protein E1264_36190 [Actinomadura sp. KC216]|uniref:hypothetical protein n=1 Tax=Actinomadura sp. KC216 TaxID=2530370 RepID=UPI0010477013|nr:hypothetical protein [Actinomadura sp. KC216]TDB78977.1 hypothetical protein E1264_36190 [Actinomadura sp. KC216]
MTAPGGFRVVLQNPKRDAPITLAVLGFLCVLCIWGAVAVDNVWRYVLAVLGVLLVALIPLLVVQLLPGREFLTYIDARGLVVTSGKRPEEILPAERFRQFEVVDPGGGGPVTLKLSYSKDGDYEPPKQIRGMEESPGRLLLAMIKDGEGGGSLSLEDLWRLRRFVEETGVGTWSEQTRPH